jgi:hypothetical protein
METFNIGDVILDKYEVTRVLGKGVTVSAAYVPRVTKLTLLPPTSRCPTDGCSSSAGGRTTRSDSRPATK